MPDEAWLELVNTNLGGTFYCTREAVRIMRAGGHGGVIINVGSSAVAGGREGEGAYSASKAGIHCLTEAVAIEGRPHGIYAYTVVPRRTATQLRRALYPTEDPAVQMPVEAVAQMVCSVATEWQPWLTGHAFWIT